MAQHTPLSICGHLGHRRSVVGSLGSLGSVLLCAGRQLRVGGVAEAHETEATGQGRVFLDGRRGRAVLIGHGPVPPRVVDTAARLRTGAAILGGSMASVCQVFCRLVQTFPVAALEQAGGIQGTPAFEILLAAAGS